jgi:PASTA domain
MKKFFFWPNGPWFTPSRICSAPDLPKNGRLLETVTDDKRVVVPDVTGLFYGACLEVAGRLGLHVAPVLLTPHPMPVDGLVVGQTPAPGERAHRESTVTVQVWHPSEPGGG